MSIAYGAYHKTDAQPSHIDNYSGGQSVAGQTDVVNMSSKFPVLNLHVCAKNLKDMDVVTVSDPICALFLMQQNQWVEFSRTEVIWNNLNPEWVKAFSIMYVFEIRQPIMFRVYDVDSEKANLESQNLIGEAQIELSQLVTSPGSTMTVRLTIPRSSENRGELTITAEQVENCASIVSGQFTGINLHKKMFHSFSPFFIISKASEGGRFLPVYQSEVNKNMTWKPFEVPYQSLCNMDPDRPIRITVLDYYKHKAAVPIGQFDTTFARLSEQIQQSIPFINSNHKEKGQIVVKSFNLIQKFSFYDYLRGGVQLNLITAIDFTASNRDPEDPRSLHYFSPNGDSMNQYERCIRAVGEILCPYDSDQLFPVLGFGAKISGIVQHCFALTFNPQLPCVHGLEGIMGAYKNALTQVVLSGPTLFSHVIRYASQMANQSWAESRTYTILLIITDGIINDMQDTVDAIVDAGRIPLSIIIIGVGTADFSAMDTLDADDEPLVSRAGKKMERDLVQFVPFNKYQNVHYSQLATEVLDEVPRQLCEWAEMNGVRPSQPSQ